jgi:ATP-dependent exoDNAse (exonuclease V) alpha subunit
MDPNYPTNALHVYAQNIQCKLRNEKMLNNLDGPLYISRAIDSTDDNGVVGKLSEKVTDTGNLEEILLLKTGARVIMTNNVDVTDGLTNGAYGTVCAFITNNDDKDTDENIIKMVLVRFDSKNVGVKAMARSQYRDTYPDCVPVSRIEVSFQARKRSKTIMVTRCQIPLFLAWAVTIHKVQGMTLPEIVVDMTYDKG